MIINPYLNFNGQCAEAFRFYQQVLGGTMDMMKHGDSPMRDHVEPEWHDAVLHALLKVDGCEIMGSDVPPQYFQKPQGFGVTVQVESTAEAERIFNAFAEGGTVGMPLDRTFWSPAFGMVVDRYGTAWMVSAAPEASS